MATNTDEIKKLKKQLKDMESLLKKFTDSAASTIEVKDSDRDILFTSLYPGILNLSTEGNGSGEIYTFLKFGEEQNIPYSNAKQIIKNNKRFITEGYVFISDDGIIKSERLESNYKSLLSKKGILDLFKANRVEFESIFEKMTNAQKEILHQIIIDKLTKNESVDMNIVYYINQSLNINIIEEVENGKGLREEN